MPDGDKTVIQRPDVRSDYAIDYKMIDAVPYTKATSSVYVGPWCDVATLKAAMAQVNATGLTGTVNIEGTLEENPVAGTTGYPLCTAPTGSTMVALTMPVRYARARISGFTAGSLTVRLHGVA